MYLRLVVPRPHEDSHRDTGLFAVAYEHIENDEVDAGQRAWLCDVIAWFRHNLHAPDISDPRAIFWFRDQPSPCLEHIWELGTALREVGENPQMIKTSQPGIVVYEDSHQVAAVPFRSTFR